MDYYMDVYEVLAKYYPIGMAYVHPDYDSFSGCRLRQELCDKKRENASIEKWQQLLKLLTKNNSQVLNVKTISQEYYPCWSADILLSQEKNQTTTYTRSIQIHLSILGPFFCVFGLDTVKLNQVERELDPLIYVSPFSIYEPWFNSIRNVVKVNYSGYKFLPFGTLQQRVPGLSVPDAVNYFDQDASVFQGLFTLENVTNYLTIGDEYYE
jgi:hypothetical protein